MPDDKKQKDEKRYKTVSVNRIARHEYDVLKTVECGLVLTGSEIKSIRQGKVQLRESFARPAKGEIWLHGAHIAQYAAASAADNHEPDRPRKLLLHKDQIDDLDLQVASQGLTLIPLRMYFKEHRVKLELALARGRKQYDKRQAIAKRDAERRMRVAIRQRTK